MIGIEMIHDYNNIISISNLCDAWGDFVGGKKFKKDVAEFSLHLSRNIYVLCEDLETKRYRHGTYEEFSIQDPKQRIIHKATVLDRVVHRAIYRIISPYFDKKFIHDSYSCRVGKGTHKAMDRFRDFGRKVARNNTRTCWVLKCDIRKFFASIDHVILKQILVKHIADKDVMWLLGQVINSFNTEGRFNVGLPLGNLTSQLLVNIYMNEFDQHVKHVLKVKYYIRYADDFVLLHNDKRCLEGLLSEISEFLETRLKLSLHPNKVSVSTLSSGVDFLGWVHFPDHRVLRTVTRRRMMKRIGGNNLSSYTGLLKHGNAYKLFCETSLNNRLEFL